MLTFRRIAQLYLLLYCEIGVFSHLIEETRNLSCYPLSLKFWSQSQVKLCDHVPLHCDIIGIKPFIRYFIILCTQNPASPLWRENFNLSVFKLSDISLLSIRDDLPRIFPKFCRKLASQRFKNFH